MQEGKKVAEILWDAQAEALHGSCVLGYYDPQDGVVCGCRVVLGIRISAWDEQVEVQPPVVPEASAEQESVLVTAGRAMVGQELDPITAAVALIDPTKPYGPKEVEEHILDSAARLERGMVFEAALIAAAHEATVRFELARARALVGLSGGDAEQRKARALVMCEPEYTAMFVAIRARDAMKSTTHSLRSVLSAYQSVGKSVAAAYGATNQVQDARQRRHF